MVKLEFYICAYTLIYIIVYTYTKYMYLQNSLIFMLTKLFFFYIDRHFSCCDRYVPPYVLYMDPANRYMYII